ncbi:MAG: Fic family protein [Burkholderiales bacterium]|nr:Fic family protein [Burkholderiales bacterium]
MTTASGPKPSARYIWQQPDWPRFRIDMTALADELQQARLQQGILLGQLQAIGLPRLLEVSGDVWMQEAIATAAIEGQKLELASVRSSVLHRLGLQDHGAQDRHVDGLIDVMQDATSEHDAPLDLDRLCRWQSALFPGGTSGLLRIAIGRLRDHEDPMQIVSGRPGREVVHYTAPPSRQVGAELEAFLAWFEASRPEKKAPSDTETPLNGIVRAALAHLWFESIHPFEDGNGRLGRAIVDLALAQDADSHRYLFSLSSELLSSRRAYYDALNAAQCGTLDVTPWILWFVRIYTQACQRSQRIVLQAIAKSAFWQRATEQSINKRQHKILARLVEAGDGEFLGGMTADKYAKMTGVSKATATRDLADLLAKSLFVVEGVGKATRYAVNVKGWNQ